jgi:EpsI family protein
MLAAGIACFAVGRSQDVALLEVAGLLPLLAGCVAILGGRAALRAVRFPLLFLLFCLPYPAWLIDMLTSPLKSWVSVAAEAVLYAAGYPVARSGVMLGLGHYRLLVADACSGLHSIVFLSALGLLYLHLSGPRRLVHWLAVVSLLVPIAVLANFVRVILLLLLTYHFGNAVGQSFWHDFAGTVLFVSAFAMLVAVDFAATRLAGLPAARRPPGPVPAGARPVKSGRFLALTASLVLAMGLAALLKPTAELAVTREAVHLGELVPERFGDWQRDDQVALALVAPEQRGNLDRLYNQTLERVYVNAAGQRVMLSIAYGSHQLGNALQAHRPEFCYTAQGFELLGSADGELTLAGGTLPVRRVLARQGRRFEPITYWMTVGDEPVVPGLRRKLAQLRHGLGGQIPDGALIRVSSLSTDAPAAFAVHAGFIVELHQALAGRSGQGVLFGHPAAI